MYGTGFPCGGTQSGEAAGTYDVTSFPVSYSGGLGGKVTAAPLRHVCDAHASGAAHQALPDGKIRPKYAYEVAETGCEDSGKLHGVNLQPHGK